MTEIPHHQRAGIVKLLGDGGHVVQRAGAIIDLRQHGDRDPAVEQGFDRGAVGPEQPTADRTTGGFHGAFDDVEVGREQFIFGNHHVAIGPQRDGGMDRLEEVDRCGVAYDCLTRSRPDQGSDAIAEPDRQVEPPRVIPAPDEILAPFPFDGVAQNVCRGARHRSERISVEIDQALGKHKAITDAAKRIAAILRDTRIARRHGGRRDHGCLSRRWRGRSDAKPNGNPDVRSG